MSILNCPLCHNTTSEFFSTIKKKYRICSNCEGISLENRFMPTSTEEKERYLEHNNDVNDKRYQQFVSPITQAVQRDFTPAHSGLDFGAGTGPVIAKVLRDNHFKVETYDPFFHNNPALLQQKYDYIACCEVMEHFHRPDTEFKLLRSLLKPDGKLFCMTKIYQNNTDFKRWYYKDDPTHVFFYSEKSLHYIKATFGFTDLEISGDLIIFSA